MTDSLDTLRTAGRLSILDVQFAKAMGRLANEHRPEVLLAAALASKHVTQGHVCLDLRSWHRDNASTESAWPALASWLDTLRSSPMVSPDGITATPLVLDDSGRLYLRRYWLHEKCLADMIGSRVRVLVDGVDTAELEAGLGRLFPPPQDAQPDLQRAAAMMAVKRLFSVVSGGPGTGKTYTVVKILALLIEQALKADLPVPHMTLMAPTGKAAARLSESIKKAKAGLNCSDAVKQAIVEEATTIHRALGSIRGTSTRFRHNEQQPLATDIVLVDEASMVNVALMARLIAAVPQHARLILLGDKDQLASVEAGAVLGDICNTSNTSSTSPSPEPDETGIWNCVTHLEKSHRYGEGSGIEALARAINAGNASAALAVLESSDYADVAIEEPAATDQLGSALARTVLDGYADYLRDSHPFERIAKFDKLRVLCGHRSGPRGVAVLNEQIRDLLRRKGKIHGHGDLYAGRPVMVTVNDYELRLYNGDIGLVLPNPDGDGLRAFFGATQATQRVFAPSRLPAHQTVFAMSVHKSQGSEFDEVAVVLPDRPSPVVTRELLYTAVTRAKKRVVIHASRQVVLHTIKHKIVRASGLRSALWGEAAGD